MLNVKSILARLHGRMGDFWWYSLVIFCAARVADVLNAFVGLWLVPKFVDPSELGAVMPLTNFASFLAVPAWAFANTFRNELSRLTTSGEFGKLKTLMKGVFIASGVFLLAAIVLSRIALPHFLERIRIAEGSLGVLIVVSSFVGATQPVFTSALQALKKFNASAVIGIVGAPVRLVAMLAAMPLRSLSGYFVGQAATPAFQIGASVYCLRKELSVPAQPYWNAGIAKRFSKLMAIFAATSAAGCLCVLVESTVLRQRLPDLDSAGYYMATRFSEIATILSATLTFTIFPFAAEITAKGRSANALIMKSALASLAFSVLVAAFFHVFGGAILSVLPHGEDYAQYRWAIPWLVGIGFLASFAALFATAEIAAGRFGYLKWMLPLDLGYPALLLVVTGYGYFDSFAPAAAVRFLDAHNIRSLGAMLCWMTAFNLLKAVLCVFEMHRNRRRGI